MRVFKIVLQMLVSIPEIMVVKMGNFTVKSRWIKILKIKSILTN